MKLSLFAGLVICATVTLSQENENFQDVDPDSLSLQELSTWIEKISLSDPAKATKYSLHLLSDAKSTNEQGLQAKANEFLSRQYMEKGDFPSALQYSQEALKLFRELGERREECLMMIQMAMILSLQKDYEESLRKLVLAEQIAYGEHEDLQGRIARRKANTFQYQKLLDSALYYNFKSLDLEKKIGRKEGIYNTYHNLGYIYMDKGDLDSAKYFLSLSLEYDLIQNDLLNIGVSHQILTRLAIKERDFQLAESHAKKALFYLDSVKSNTSKVVLLGLMPIIYAALGDSEKAYKYHLQHSSLKDSLYSSRVESRVAMLETTFKVYEKDKELLFQKEIIDKQRKYLLTLGTLIVSILIVFYLLFNRYRLKRKVEILQTDNLKKELNVQALNMINLNNSLGEIENELKVIKSKPEVSPRDIQKLLSSIVINKSLDREWEKFESYFANIHSRFSEDLMKRHASLTQLDRRFAALIKLDLSNREIAGILNIENRSVIMNRYRLKKKLSLKEDEDLSGYINSI